MAPEIRDEGAAWCMQIKTACISGCDGGGKRELPDVLERGSQDAQPLHAHSDEFFRDEICL